MTPFEYFSPPAPFTFTYFPNTSESPPPPPSSLPNLPPSPPLSFQPFVEKPVSGDDHNIRIYYPGSAGGGMKGLFRKVGGRKGPFREGLFWKTGAYLLYIL